MSSTLVREHYERHPYPHYPLLATVRQHDTFALNLPALWARFNGEYLHPREGRILSAGCGSFAPYPLSVANPKARITALDLSAANLRRARLHSLFHGRRNIDYRQGDLLSPQVAPGPFHFIDCFGVIHHLADPVSGLIALQERLVAGGIIRVMVYGRYARREAESIRRAAILLGIRDLKTMKRLLGRARSGSQLGSFCDASSETRYDAGIADLFLHPVVQSFRIDDFLALVARTRLTPLLFAHQGALADPGAEFERLQELDHRRQTPTNIICYLGLGCQGGAPLGGDTLLMLNPALAGSLSPLALSTLRVAPRLGSDPPQLDRAARRFLRRFTSPLPIASLSPTELSQATPHINALFLIPFKRP
ncbi:MAG TPA: methyltransferase [Geobacterales bacterium]|nr:methyltransferase [Geobacterales bacterium]